MARLRDQQPAPSEDTEALAAHRFTWLSRFLMASEANTPAATKSAALLAEARRLEGRHMTDSERLEALRSYLDGVGLRDAAERFADHMQRFRAGLNKAPRK